MVSELTALGYPSPQPPPLGQQQTFDWVADCLLWLCKRSAPGLAAPPRDYGSEAARVAFLSTLGARFYDGTRLRLNLRRLYRAGGSAARELHRLAAALRAAEQAVAAMPPPVPPPAAPPSAAALRRHMDAGLAAARKQAVQLEQAVAAAGQEVQVLEGRVEKRHVELDRLDRRLDSLQAVKPAHSGEIEALEADLGGLYQQYLHKFRNLEYLEGVLDKYGAARQAEAEEADRQLRRIQRQVAAEELRLLQGSGTLSGGAAAIALGPLDSEDSEAELQAGGWGKKALPQLALGVPGGGSKATAAAAAALDLLPGEDSSGSAGGTGAITGHIRLSMASSMKETAGEAAPAGASEGRGVSFGSASTIPAHRGSAAGTAGMGASTAAASGAPRPGSAQRRATGSASGLLLRRGGSGSSADVLMVDRSAVRQGSMHDAGIGGGNDF